MAGDYGSHFSLGEAVECATRVIGTQALVSAINHDGRGNYKIEIMFAMLADCQRHQIRDPGHIHGMWMDHRPDKFWIEESELLKCNPHKLENAMKKNLLADEKTVTGAALLDAVNGDIADVQRESVYDLLRDTVVEIKKREAWIEARTKQKEDLANIQVEVVKAFDAGNFTKEVKEKFEGDIRTIKNARVSNNEQG